MRKPWTSASRSCRTSRASNPAYNERVRYFFVAVLAIAAGFGAAVWYYQNDRVMPLRTASAPADDTDWVDELYSQNPAEAADAARRVEALGAQALPTITVTLKNPGAEPERVKAALKACGIIGPAARAALSSRSARCQSPRRKRST